MMTKRGGGRVHRGCAAAVILVLVAAGACSDSGSGSEESVPTATGPIVGDGRCDDPTGDVYKSGDPEAAPTGLAPGLDLTVATASIEGEELHLHFETVASVQDAELPEVILFGGRPEDAGRFEVRATRSEAGWAVRVVTFTAAGEPQIAGITATVEAHGTVVDFELPVGLLPPMGDFISFAYATTGMAGAVAVNDECFPFAGRTPVGG